jgi:hypothetical protein
MDPSSYGPFSFGHAFICCSQYMWRAGLHPALLPDLVFGSQTSPACCVFCVRACRWLENHTSCPICRKDLDATDDQPSSSNRDSTQQQQRQPGQGEEGASCSRPGAEPRREDVLRRTVSDTTSLQGSSASSIACAAVGVTALDTAAKCAGCVWLMVQCCSWCSVLILLARCLCVTLFISSVTLYFINKLCCSCAVCLPYRCGCLSLASG